MAQVVPLVFVDDMRIEVKVEVNFLVRGTAHPMNRASLASAARNQLLADVEPHTTQVRSSTGARGLVRPEGSLNRFDNSAANAGSERAIRRQPANRGHSAPRCEPRRAVIYTFGPCIAQPSIARVTLN
jgi:hypothetical protein